MIDDIPEMGGARSGDPAYLESCIAASKALRYFYAGNPWRGVHASVYRAAGPLMQLKTWEYRTETSGTIWLRMDEAKALGHWLVKNARVPLRLRVWNKLRRLATIGRVLLAARALFRGGP